ncbi:rhamnogalacturonan acetylesterase [Pedobacter alpinus]|uniref:Rhamnogalacturonan acetylesterase n=1 Tax=Pedobacter alpinus TaxID=1590643 RepID=A0ABW5TX43_9SPHI
MKQIKFLTIPALILFASFTIFKKKIATVYLIGDSTVADYSLENDYQSKRFPQVGWGQVFQPLLLKDSLYKLRNITKADSIKVDDRAKGGRSTRTFFEEGKWSAVYKSLKKGDIVMIQFGHNDASKDKPERFVDIPGYKEFLRLYVSQTRDKGALPILLTPVARNYPWENGKLSNVHGEYPQAVKEVAKELNVKLVDLNELSMIFFSSKGEEYVSNKYFMNLDSGEYDAYPNGQKDNTHFQTEGGVEVAKLVYNAMKD